MAALPVSDRAAKVSDPGTSGWTRLETREGRRLNGWIEGRGQAGTLELVDSAGNRFVIPGTGIVGDPVALEASASPCRRASGWDTLEREALLDLLRGYLEPRDP
jgi:hypothetical protein